MIISLNLTMVSLMALRSGALNRLLRQRKPGTVGATVHTLYCALSECPRPPDVALTASRPAMHAEPPFCVSAAFWLLCLSP